MRVLVLWANDDSANLGVRVLAQGAAIVARNAFGPETEVEFQDLGPNREGFRVSTDLIKRDIGRPRGPIKQWLRGFDAVLDTGAGDSFTDIYGRNRLARIVYTQLTARRLGLPVALLPQTYGPFENRLNRLAARRALRRANVVVARDMISLEYAQALSKRSVVASTDMVFALPVQQQPKSRDIVLNVSGLLWSENRHVDARAYRSTVTEFVQRAAAAGRTVSLMPHVLENSTSDNDMLAIRDLESVGPDLDVVIPKDLTHAREILSSAAAVVGSRMHACLNAISVGTPAIPWAYSRKFEPLLRDLDWRHTIDLRTSNDVPSRTLELLSDQAALVASAGESGLIARDRIHELTRAIRSGLDGR